MAKNIDILSIDSKIKNDFNMENKKLPKYEKQLEELKQTLNNATLNHRNSKNVNENIDALSDKIKNIKTCRDYNFYISESAELLENYKKILHTPMKLSFVGTGNRPNKEKEKVIREYLKIASKYTDISDIEFSFNRVGVVCNNCNNKKHFDVIDNSIYICILCGSQQEILLHTSSYKDIDRINIFSKYVYDRKVHFRDCINQYQGNMLYKIVFALFYILPIFSS